MTETDDNLGRYQRQIVFPQFGLAGQRALSGSSALIVGVGGLGSWAAELLARAGVGMLRLADDDRVELLNLHRQALYSQADAEAGLSKVEAASARLAELNPQVRIEAHTVRVTCDNLPELATGVDIIIDGTDNFATRFIINDYCVQQAMPWVFAGVVGAEAQVLAVVPGQTACLRCLYDTPAPPCVDPTCRSAGVLGPAVAAIASLQATEALKILSGNAGRVRPQLLKLDLWENTIQRIAAGRADADCPCCGLGVYDYLEP